MLVDFVLVELLEVAPGFLYGKVVKLHCELFNLLEDIAHLLVIKQPTLLSVFLCLRHLDIHGIFRQFPHHMHFRGCRPVEVLLLTGYFVDKSMSGGSSNSKDILFPREVQ